MAKYAIISDIHANYHALSAVIEDVRDSECTDIVCLGDIIGYNAYPKECLNYIRALNCPVVMGDHDKAVADPELARINETASRTMSWTLEQLEQEDLQWLSEQPFQRHVRSDTGQIFSIAHASLDHPKEWNNISTIMDAANSIRRQISPVSFHGHTHKPSVFVSDGASIIADHDTLMELSLYGEAKFTPNPNFKYSINVGSVGQPWDGDPRSCYAIYDTDNNLIILRRVAYDIQAEQAAIRALGLPEYLAERLERGQS